MRTVMFASQKGGPGKSLLCQSTSVCVAGLGMGSVAVMDLDPQGSTTDWWNERPQEVPRFIGLDEEVTQLLAELPRPADLPERVLVDLQTRLAAAEKMGFDFCFIDTQGSLNEITRTTLQVADVVVIPVLAGWSDLKALRKFVWVVEASGRPFFFVLNRVVAKTRIAEGALASLAGLGRVCPQKITDRVNLGAVAAGGGSIPESMPGSDAAREIENLTEYILDQFPEGRAARPKARAKEKAL